MNPRTNIIWLITSIGVIGCQGSATAPPLRALERSGAVALLCREATSGTGRSLRACPDPDDSDYDGEDRRVVALMTQTLRGEVAVIDLHEREIVDEDPYVPGREFLPVGANPTSIVSTPGGIATFVGVAESGREGIFALPTTCIDPVEPGEQTRDLSLWAACRLPAAPGEMSIAVDTQPGFSDSPSQYRSSCPGSTATEWTESATSSFDDRRQDCPADLEREEQIAPVGRRKLVVTLPDLGQIAIYDAQAILNQPAGSFAPCVPDSVLPLSVEGGLQEVEQPVPSDLVPGPDCEAPPPRYSFGPPPSGYQARPSGISFDGSRLFVADLGAPVVHVVDLADPCSPQEEPPLLPRAFDEPSRAVMTRDVAVGQPTLAEQQFVYAVDDADGSAMVFQVDPSAASRTPIVRPGTPYLPFEPPDRVRLDSPIRDLQLITHDEPSVDPTTGTAEIGTLCDPNPSDSGPGTLYRTSSDYSSGAGPRKLRGSFALLALGSGQIAAVDVEDWDAACRRPASNNPISSGIDWRGCVRDPNLASDRFEVDGNPVVSNETSCRVVEPHRLRSGSYLVTSTETGIRAPSLTTFPRLTSSDGGVLPTGLTDQGRRHPKMLAVPFTDPAQPGTEPELYVGTTAFTLTDRRENAIPVDPARAENNGLLLPMVEPRAYSATEDFTATFEGTVLTERHTGQLPVPVDGQIAGAPRSLADSELLLRDPDAWFCDQGVQDSDVTRSIGQEMGASDEQVLDRFVQRHDDFAELTDDFDQDDPYFDSSAAADRCGTTDLLDSCQAWFGTREDPLPARELRIVEAYHSQLIVSPRSAQPAETWVQRIHCCFPSVHGYVIRAGDQWVVRGSQLLSDIVPGDGLRCVRDCEPRRSHLHNRVFEIASTDPTCASPPPDSADLPDCWIGPVDADGSDLCTTDAVTGGIDPSEIGTSLPGPCVYDSLKARFSIYRGLEQSARDMTFSWTVRGGFSPLTTSIVSQSAGLSVLPQEMLYSEQLDAMVVVDGESGGLSLVGLGSFEPLGEPYL